MLDLADGRHSLDMTDWLDVSSDTPRRSYLATAGQTVFTFPFVFFQNSDLQVYVNNVLKTIITDYAVSGALNPAGGSVTFNAGLNLNDSVVIARVIDIALSSHVPPSGPLDFGALNLQFSKVVAMLQQLEINQVRSLLQPDSDVADIGRLPAKTVRALQMMGFDVNGDPIAASAATSPVSAAMAPVIAAATVAAARTLLGTTAFGDSLLLAASQAAARTLLALTPGTDVQAFSSTLAAIVSTGITTAMFAANVADTDVALAAASNLRFATQGAVKSYIDTLLVNGRMRARGSFYWTGAAVTLSGQSNVTSVVRNSVGNYTVTMTTAMPDANYQAFGSSIYLGSTNSCVSICDTYATTTFRILCYLTGGTLQDPISGGPIHFGVWR